MMRSLYSGVSGLKTHQTKMDVIGNNIANVNTVAFKSSSVTFTDIMYQTTSGASKATDTVGGKNAKQIGLGVTNGSTKVSITSAGAAQSTGEAFDIKLTDSNNTNFFIVSNGTEKLFTRSGSFYVDGNGNLAMSSTGYIVQGWQVDSANPGTIKKDTVSALRIMNSDNMTSEPEATTQAYVSGIVDKNDTNMTSDTGYYMSLNFYDNTGYSYAAKFAIKTTPDNADAGSYTVELVSIMDSETPSKDILAEYVAAGGSISDIFGNATDEENTLSLVDGYTFDSANARITYSGTDGNTYYLTESSLAYDADGNPVGYFVQDASGPVANTGSNAGEYYTTSDGATNGASYSSVSVTAADGTVSSYPAQVVTFAALYGQSLPDTVNTDSIKWTDDGDLYYTYAATNYDLQFNTKDGTFKYVNEAGSKDVTLKMTNLAYGTSPSDKFSDVSVDFSGLLNYDNGGTSTAAVEKGGEDGTTGVGKKLGSLIGVSVDQSGKIYGSYDNGNTVLLGQIAVAQFSNASGLESTGNSCYRTTLNSGDFDGMGVEITADGGSMATGQLEMSNVDLSTEFTEMIVTQRGFQANSRIITVSDTMLEELTNLKR